MKGKSSQLIFTQQNTNQTLFVQKRQLGLFIEFFNLMKNKYKHNPVIVEYKQRNMMSQTNKLIINLYLMEHKTKYVCQLFNQRINNWISFEYRDIYYGILHYVDSFYIYQKHFQTTAAKKIIIFIKENYQSTQKPKSQQLSQCVSRVTQKLELTQQPYIDLKKILDIFQKQETGLKRNLKQFCSSCRF